MYKKILLVLAIVFSLFFLIWFVWADKSRENQPQIPSPSILPSPSLPPRDQSGWNGIIPGKNTYQNVIAAWGNPKGISTESGQLTITYPGTNTYWDTTVTFHNNVVSFIREHVFLPGEISFKARTSFYSEDPVKLYGQPSLGGIYLFVFPSRGIAFIANEARDIVYEVWYFPPSPLSQLLRLAEFREYSPDEKVPLNP